MIKHETSNRYYFLWVVILLILISVVGGSKLFILISKYRNDGPENWAPFFTFFRNENCYQQFVKNSNVANCNPLGIRAISFEKTQTFTVAEHIQKLEIVVMDRNASKKAQALNLHEWKCDQSSFARTGQANIDPFNFTPRQGDVIYCWPITSLTNTQTIDSLSR